jgi:hypothetical protein
MVAIFNLCALDVCLIAQLQVTRNVTRQLEWIYPFLIFDFERLGVRQNACV